MPFLAPLIPAVIAFSGTFVGSLVISTAISVGTSLLGGWIKSLTTPKPDPAEKPKPQGFRLQVVMGDTLPLSFTVGYAATAGSRKYIGSWGNSGEVPNAYLTEVIQVGDLPVPGLDGFWANKQRCTIASTGLTDKGYPVLEFRVGGIDHMWVKFRTGLETTADTFMVSTFGANPTYPWSSQFIGRGSPHAIVTTLINRNLFKSQPTFLFEPTPRAFYDLRKDSTNGGSGSHRWTDQTTWEPTRNPVVIMYNIIRGVYYNGEWIYGGRNLPAFRLPASSWMAAANECDAPIALAAGGTEPQYRCGSEIAVNVDPLDTIEELKRSCNARLAEIGGIWEILVGAPGAAVYSFTDAEIIISRGQTYTSFPGLNDTHNAIEATYPEPAEYWSAKAAPARYNAEYELEDGGRRLATGIAFSSVPYAVQTQRLMKSLIEDDRRFRTHFITLPPSAWILTGTCVVSWTSERNGYVNKKFLVIKIDGEPGMMQPVLLREIDPTDYAWTAAEEISNPIGELVIIRPGSQLMSGWQVAPAIIYDADGTPRRPSIQITYDGNMPDIQAVRVVVRLKASGVIVFDGEVPFATPYSVVLNGVFLNNTIYEAAGKYIPYSGRETDFSSFLEVLTPDVKLVSGKDFDPFAGVVGFDQLGSDLGNYQEYMGLTVREILLRLQALDNNSSDQEFANMLQFGEMRRDVATSIGSVSAEFSEIITTAVVPINGQLIALADAVTSVTASDGTDLLTARFRMTTQTGVPGYSRIGAETRDDNTDPTDWRGAAWYLDTPNNPLLPTRMLINADQFLFLTGSGPTDLANPFIIDVGGLRVNNALVKNASIETAAITSAKIGSAEIKTANIDALAVTSAKIDNLAVTAAKIDNLAVTSAKIDNLAVTTLKIVNGAVTDLYGVNVSTSTGGVGTYTLASINISLGQYPVNIGAYINLSRTGLTADTFTLRLLVNGVVIDSQQFSFTSGTVTSSLYMAVGANSFPGGAGTYTYSLQLQLNGAGGDYNVSGRLAATLPRV